MPLGPGIHNSPAYPSLGAIAGSRYVWVLLVTTVGILLKMKQGGYPCRSRSSKICLPPVLRLE